MCFTPHSGVPRPPRAFSDMPRVGPSCKEGRYPASYSSQASLASTSYLERSCRSLDTALPRSRISGRDCLVVAYRGAGLVPLHPQTSAIRTLLYIAEPVLAVPLPAGTWWHEVRTHEDVLVVRDVDDSFGTLTVYGWPE
jgi:hypothetical protein